MGCAQLHTQKPQYQGPESFVRKRIHLEQRQETFRRAAVQIYSNQLTSSHVRPRAARHVQLMPRQSFLSSATGPIWLRPKHWQRDLGRTSQQHFTNLVLYMSNCYD